MHNQYWNSLQQNIPQERAMPDANGIRKGFNITIEYGIFEDVIVTNVLCQTFRMILFAQLNAIENYEVHKYSTLRERYIL